MGDGLQVGLLLLSLGGELPKAGGTTLWALLWATVLQKAEALPLEFALPASTNVKHSPFTAFPRQASSPQIFLGLFYRCGRFNKGSRCVSLSHITGSLQKCHPCPTVRRGENVLLCKCVTVMIRTLGWGQGKVARAR